MFNFKTVKFNTKDGTPKSVILLTGDDIDKTDDFKDAIKNTYGASWIGNLKTWGWYVPPKREKMLELINSKVKPCIEFLRANEKNNSSNEDKVTSIVDDLIKMLLNTEEEAEKEADGNVYLSSKQIMAKVYEFKQKLINAVTSEDFKKLFIPIINLKRVQGKGFSLKNTILAWVQRPNMTLVKSKADWNAMNRLVKPDAVPIALFKPYGGKKLHSGQRNRKNAEQEWMNANHITSKSEMTPGDKERLRHYLNAESTVGKYKLVAAFYDYADTVQMEGKEDIVGDIQHVDTDWYNDTGSETERVKEKIEALLSVIQDSGVKFTKIDSLGGALGVSKGGVIEILNNAAMNSNMFMTIAHEFAHELLHQRYLKDKNNEFSQFYIGRDNGKGPVEQQAELTAWIVLNFYGYDIQEAINYMAVWGMTDEKAAVKAFDMVANVSNFIIEKINDKIIKTRGIQESVSRDNEANITGLDVAKLLGPEAVKAYNDGVEELRNGNEEKPVEEPVEEPALGLREAIMSEIEAQISPTLKRSHENASEKLAQLAFGDDYGKEYTASDFNLKNNTREDGSEMPLAQRINSQVKPQKYDKKVALSIAKNADIENGFFSQGNLKLSPDTLIIDFTCAYYCPSRGLCPISQVVCYALAGENRYPFKLRKNLMIQGTVHNLIKKGELKAYFDAAKEYILSMKGTKYEVHWVRFNEGGDFPIQMTDADNQAEANHQEFINGGRQYVIDLAADFAKDVFSEEYGYVRCMAYSANGFLDFSKASKYIAINASTNAVLKTLDPSSIKRNFFGIPHQQFQHQYCDIDKGLAPANDHETIATISDVQLEQAGNYYDTIDRNGNAEYVSDTNSLRHLGTLHDVLNGAGLPDDNVRETMSTPILEKGTWYASDTDDSTGMYYVCPCGFWKDEKDRYEMQLVEEAMNDIYGKTLHDMGIYGTEAWGRYLTKKAKNKQKERIDKVARERINKIRNILARTPSPCGTRCSVCFDREGGITLQDAIRIHRKEITPEEAERVKRYYVLTSLHGPEKDKYNPRFSEWRRDCDIKDVNKGPKYSEENPKGFVNLKDRKALSDEEYDELVRERDRYLASRANQPKKQPKKKKTKPKKKATKKKTKKNESFMRNDFQKIVEQQNFRDILSRMVNYSQAKDLWACQ